MNCLKKPIKADTKNPSIIYAISLPVENTKTSKSDCKNFLCVPAIYVASNGVQDKKHGPDTLKVKPITKS